MAAGVDVVATSAAAVAVGVLAMIASAVTATADTNAVTTGVVAVVTSAVLVPMCAVAVVAGSNCCAYTIEYVGHCSRHSAFIITCSMWNILWVVERHGLNVSYINDIPTLYILKSQYIAFELV